MKDFEKEKLEKIVTIMKCLRNVGQILILQKKAENPLVQFKKEILKH